MFLGFLWTLFYLKLGCVKSEYGHQGAKENHGKRNQPYEYPWPFWLRQVFDAAAHIELAKPNVQKQGRGKRCRKEAARRCYSKAPCRYQAKGPGCYSRQTQVLIESVGRSNLWPNHEWKHV